MRKRKNLKETKDLLENVHCFTIHVTGSRPSHAWLGFAVDMSARLVNEYSVRRDAACFHREQ